MKCQDIDNLLDNHADIGLTSLQRASVGDHLSSCERCKSAWRSAQALHSWTEIPVSRPRAGLFEEVMGHITAATPRLPHRPFWLGTAVGGALAASIVVAVLGLNPALRDDATDSVPALTIALHQTRDLSVAINSAGALPGARIRVVLTGGVELEGFAGRSELSWTTDLVAGINRLRLPVTAISGDEGQVLVEVQHHDKRQVFLVRVDVDAGSGDLEATFFGNGAKRQAAFAPPAHRSYFVKFPKPETRFYV